MIIFKVKAINKSGQEVSRHIEADNRQEAIRKCKAEGLLVIGMSEAPKIQSLTSTINVQNPEAVQSDREINCTVRCPYCGHSCSTKIDNLLNEEICSQCKGKFTLGETSVDQKPATSNRKRYATKQQKELLQYAKAEVTKGLTFEDAKEQLLSFVSSGRLTQEIFDNPWLIEPATQKQLAFLTKLGIVPRDGLTKGDASEIIDDAQNQKAMSKPMSDNQAVFIAELGGAPESGMSMFQAGQYIEWLLDQQIECPKCSSLTSPFLSRCKSCGGFLSNSNISSRVPKNIYISKMGLSRRWWPFGKR